MIVRPLQSLTKLFCLRMKHKLSLLVFLFISLIGSAQESAPIGIDDQIDQAFAPVSTFFSNVVFFTIFDIPFVLILLVFSALFFTVYFGFPNFRYFWRAIQTVRGKYEDIENHGAKVLYGEDDNPAKSHTITRFEQIQF